MITQERFSEIDAIAYELESNGNFLAYHAIEDLRSALNRAYEALRGLRQDGLVWDDPDDLIVKYRLGVYLSNSDAINAVIDYGLGKHDPDPSMKKEIK